MPDFRIELTEQARADLFFYAVPERKMILEGIRGQLSHQPLVETKNRKPLRPNPIAAWELRIGRFRVFYEGDPVARRVMVQAVGNKEHNKLFVRGNEVKL
jgi:mRNA-degrading endonuclease RelE of RelBE toxin-antitoxin system